MSFETIHHDNNEKRKESLEKTQIILDDLGLDWEKLRGKKILDIGAGLAEFAQAAKEHNIEIISLEKNPSLWKKEGIPPKDTPYVQGDAETLPFQDNSFDFVISHAAPPTITYEKNSVARVLKEVKRVLKPGGEFRFGPGNLNASIFESNELFTPDEEEAFTVEQRIARIREKSLEYLQSIDSNIIEMPTSLKEFSRSQITNFSDHFYLLRKMETAEISDSEFLKLKEIFGLPDENAVFLKWEIDNNFDPRGLGGRAVLEWKKENFDVKAKLKNINEPLIEIAGPTITGYKLVNVNELDKKLHVSNIFPGGYLINTEDEVKYEGKVDFQADAQKLPFKNETVGAVFCSCLGIIASEHSDTLNEKQKETTELRKNALEEAFRVLENGGFLIWEGGKEEDVKFAQEIGFKIRQFKVNKYFNNENNSMKFRYDYDVIFEK